MIKKIFTTGLLGVALLALPSLAMAEDVPDPPDVEQVELTPDEVSIPSASEDSSLFGLCSCC